MLLIGMFDSPFVRPVAIALKRLNIPFEHANWSVGKDFDRIREYNPLGRVPTLVLDDREILVDSLAILDYIDDELAPPGKSLLPASGQDRRAVLRIVYTVVGAMEKARDQMYERLFKPKEKWHQPWIDRCASQMSAALAELNGHAAKRGGEPWLVGNQMTRADLMVACIYTLLGDAFGPQREAGNYTALAAVTQRCEALPEFKATYSPWSAPQS